MRNNLLHKDISLSIYIIYTVVSFSIFYYGFCNVESYDAVLSMFSAQEYFTLREDMLFWDINILILPFVSWLNSFLPGVQLYGYYLLGFTFLIGFLFLKLILTSPLLDRQKRFIIAFSFIILYSSNLFFLQATRIATSLILLFFIYYAIGELSRMKLFLLFVLCALLRIDGLLLISVLYVISVYTLRLPIRNSVWLPIVGAVAFVSIYNVLLYYFGSDTVKLYYYYELEMMDKSNVDYLNISELDNYIFYLLETYSIYDEQLFNIDYIKSILLIDSGHYTNNLLEPELYFNVLKKTLSHFFLIKEILVLSFVFLLFNVMKLGIRFKIFYVFLFLFPLVACTYVIVPIRFLYPYYAFYILLSIASIPNRRISYYSIILVVLLASAIHINNLYADYESKRINFQSSIQKAEALKSKYGDKLFFENFYVRNWDFLTPDIRHIYEGNKFYFVNMGLYQYFDLYTMEWKGLTKGINGYSILEKFKFLESNNYPLIIDDIKYEEIYKEYLLKRYDYHTKVEFVVWPK